MPSKVLSDLHRKINDRVNDTADNVMHQTVRKLRIGHRVTYVNCGTCLLDDKFYYYLKTKQARCKGSQAKMYQMRSFRHFLDVFMKD